ncbi:MAG: competence/damage-inducible protein A [Ekhidna sp.]
MPATAEIISIGDEILYGQTLDTNSHWISGTLDAAGILVTRKITIGDRKEEILSAFEQAESRADIVLITGGLGPTSDDLTKPCLVEYFDTHLQRSEEMLENIRSLFQSRGREITPVNEAQADLPASCTPIKNAVGTAPGMWFERNNKVIVSMPGVPYEMRQMMEDTIIPKLKSRYVKGGIYHRMIRTIGIPESKLAEMIQDWEKELPKEIKLAYLPTMGTVKLRLTAKGDNEAELRDRMQAEIEKVLPVIDKYVYGFDNEDIEQAIGRMLREKKYMLAIAESCTGGYLAHKITSVPGSSEWFKGGMVPYSNELKSKQLDVPMETIMQHGAVSEQVVLALAKNIREAFQTDVGVSISGVAGPTGGSPEKPVGTVWIGFSDKNKTVAKRFQFTNDRDLNIKFTSMAALNMIRINLDKE